MSGLLEINVMRMAFTLSGLMKINMMRPKKRKRGGYFSVQRDQPDLGPHAGGIGLNEPHVSVRNSPLGEKRDADTSLEKIRQNRSAAHGLRPLCYLPGSKQRGRASSQKVMPRARWSSASLHRAASRFAGAGEARRMS